MCLGLIGILALLMGSIAWIQLTLISYYICNGCIYIRQLVCSRNTPMYNIIQKKTTTTAMSHNLWYEIIFMKPTTCQILTCWWPTELPKLSLLGIIRRPHRLLNNGEKGRQETTAYGSHYTVYMSIVFLIRLLMYENIIYAVQLFLKCHLLAQKNNHSLKGNIKRYNSSSLNRLSNRLQ